MNESLQYFTGSQFTIPNNRPEGVPAPETVGSLSYRPGEGLLVTMRCYEEKPRAIYHDPNGAIYTDSCMEAYVDCFPEMHRGYINVEMNANGAAFCYISTVNDKGFPHKLFCRQGI